MILFKTYCTFGALAPLALILTKWIGFIAIAWGWIILSAILIPVIMFLLLLILAIYIIKTTPIEEWAS